ncbi:hypothetical protein F5Y00DRAFT_212293 [Daldinia vernicosa]|uniref:uncharacterized protein n=1 Tax=Daldinia vernicosa TaxID=114800 RepID=UPI002008EB41|nr:uncharacterized protein F5Y00DRAFT_212293 [Daldinia vernicosa]KAI0844068.1 hypothetical protein F5Y00DRAFT_212293 [Daldinia vernicosa]
MSSIIILGIASLMLRVVTSISIRISRCFRWVIAYSQQRSLSGVNDAEKFWVALLVSYPSEVFGNSTSVVMPHTRSKKGFVLLHMMMSLLLIHNTVLIDNLRHFGILAS